MDKAYNEIVFHNDQSPDLDEINMNAISHGLSVVDDRVIQLKGDLTALYTERIINGNIYVKNGYWSNGNYNGGGAWATNKIFSVVDALKVRLDITTTQYYDAYDILDSDYNVLEFRSNPAGSIHITEEIKLPQNATYIAVNGSTANVESSQIYGVYSVDKKETLSNPLNTLNGFWDRADNTYKSDDALLFSIYNVADCDIVDVIGTGIQNTTSVVLLSSEFEYIDNMGSDKFFGYGNSYNVTFDVSNVAYIGISHNSSSEPIVKAYGYNSSESNDLIFDRVVWYGTSIPAGNKSNNYPDEVGKLIKLRVINEAVGSSSVTCKNPDRISESNPYGFTHDFELCSRCLTNTLEEMEWIINHFNDRNIFNYRTVSSLSESDKEFIRNCSYERKLLPYLTMSKNPSMFIFDHGHNDQTTMYTCENTYDAKESINGVTQTNYYANGVLVSSEYPQAIKYDLSGISCVSISGDISPYHDIYALLDSNNNVISYKANGSVQKTIKDLIVDTTGAASLVVSTGRLNITTINTSKYIYGNPDKNLYSFRGALSFLFNLIYSFNPHNRIVMIGEYENQKIPVIAEYQKEIAEKYSLPIFEAWNVYGWNQKTITTHYHWYNGVWNYDSTRTYTMTVLDSWLADGVHPHSDVSKKAIKFIAHHIAKWIFNVIYANG